MLKKLCVTLSIIALTSVPGVAQNAAAPNARTVLQAADANMGASKLNSVQYSATGYMSDFEQSYSSSPDDIWPRFDLKNYTRTVDYPSMSSNEEQLRVQGAWLPRGGFREFDGEWRQAQFVTDNFAWNTSTRTGDNAVAPSGRGVPVAELRQVDIMMTPHGFIRAALAAEDVTLSQQSDGARKINIVTFKALGKYTMNGWISDDNVVTKTQTWLPNPILGDMLVELSTKGDYKDYGGIKFPSGFHLSIGNPPHPVLDIDITDVTPNIPDAALQVPPAIRQATVRPLGPIQSRQLALGIWFLPNPAGRHNSMAVEFRDYAVVLEAPIDQELGFALINETKRLIPNKPIRYLFNTHHHFDHSGGLRAFGAEGSTVITHRSNFDFYANVVFDLRPRTLQPDPLSLAPRQVQYVLVDDSYTITDGDQTMTLYHMDGLDHAADMLVAWFPKTEIIFLADVFDPTQAGEANAREVNFLYNLRRLRIEPKIFVSVHRGADSVYPVSEFLKKLSITSILGGGSNPALNQ